MKRGRNRNWERRLWLLALTGVIAVASAGLLVADALTRPHEVNLRTRIEMYQQDDEGVWKKVDEIGPITSRFDANVLEMANGKKVGTDFALRTKTKKGRDYSVRLAEDANVDFNALTGRIDGNLVFVVTLDGKSARVAARPTTETRFGPAGALNGRRSGGILGRDPISFTVVSVNELELEGEKPMILVTQEVYRMVPRPRG
jgi:hypothetical protein